jgi:transposase
VSQDYVRDVIHAFNERGFAALDPKWSGGHPPVISEQARERICLIAKTAPAEWGITWFSTWSLKTLAEHLIEKKVVKAISREHLRRSCARPGFRGRPSRPGRPPTTRTSSPRWAVRWTLTIVRRPGDG